MTQRTRAQLLTMLDANGVGGIDGTDLNDFVDTVMPEEFANPGDYFSSPKPRYVTTDRSYRGMVDYSQTMLSDCSFGTVLALTPSGTWRPAVATNSTINPGMGIAGNSYLAGESQAIILRKGIIFLSNWSALLSGNIGRPVYLNSGTAGSIAVVKPTYAQELGVIEPADIGSTGSLGKWRFDPRWTTVGV